MDLHVIDYSELTPEQLKQLVPAHRRAVMASDYWYADALDELELRLMVMMGDGARVVVNVDKDGVHAHLVGDRIMAAADALVRKFEAEMNEVFRLESSADTANADAQSGLREVLADENGNVVEVC